MARAAIHHRRAHNLLLANNLLSHAGSSSPFTLVFDSLEQSARPLLSEVTTSAKDARLTTVCLSFETIQKPTNVDAFIPAWSLTTTQWHQSVRTHIEQDAKANRRSLIVIDSLNSICSTDPRSLPALLSALIIPSSSMIAVYHSDLVPATSHADPYSPSAKDLLSYLATTIFTVHSLHHVLARKAARDRSVQEPVFGLDEDVPGIIQGMGANTDAKVVLEMEHRRKSGRGVKEWYVLDTVTRGSRTTAARKAHLSLLEDYPGYHVNIEDTDASEDSVNRSTFELGLTEKQRRDREGVVLPYFDAQKGNDEGGRILYDMGSEDDFDEEEDEI